MLRNPVTKGHFASFLVTLHIFKSLHQFQLFYPWALSRFGVKCRGILFKKKSKSGGSLNKKKMFWQKQPLNDIIRIENSWWDSLEGFTLPFCSHRVTGSLTDTAGNLIYTLTKVELAQTSHFNPLSSYRVRNSEDEIRFKVNIAEFGSISECKCSSTIEWLLYFTIEHLYHEYSKHFLVNKMYEFALPMQKLRWLQNKQDTAAVLCEEESIGFRGRRI